jgi:hypothetical protein
MSNNSYALLHNSTDTLDVAIPVKEPALSQSTSPTNDNTGDTLQKHYIQIAIAVGLYWYEGIFIQFFFIVYHDLGLFRLRWYF